MQFSFIGFLICIIILAAAYCLRASMVTALMMSLAFGATGIVTLGSLGGSSPLIYTVFVALLAGSLAVRRSFWRELGTVLSRVPASRIVVCLLAYATLGALLFPRLFAGQTSAFVPSRSSKGVFEVPLGPTFGNITQLGYLILGGVAFFCVSVILLRRNGLEDVRRGFLIWCSLHTGMGVIDLVTKFIGFGDVLEPIRTASYAMLTQVEEAGFFRIVGAYSEASAFGGVSIACLAFTYTYWRRTSSRLALVLWLTLIVLLILSTSSTAYVGLAIISVPVAFSLSRSFAAGRLTATDGFVGALLMICMLAVMTIGLHNPGFFDPFIHLIETTVFNKANSASGLERAYWNQKSLQTFIDTGGLGIGIGSSRASSWVVAVLSQLGLLGALMMGGLLTALARPVGPSSRAGPEIEAVVSSVRACGLAGLVAATIAGSGADPGVIFFVSVAVVSAQRAYGSQRIQPDERLLYSHVSARL